MNTLRELIDLATALDEEDRKTLVRVARAFDTGRGAARREPPRTRSWEDIVKDFPKDAADELAKVIEEEFERIDPNDWA